MSRNRFYIGKKDQADLEYLEEWVADKIPHPPSGQMCECDKAIHAHESEPALLGGTVTIVDCPNLADSHLYRIDGEHVCYTFVCWGCCEATAGEDYLADQEYPATEGGYAVTPRHCA